jgi:two-component system, cell cycle sensor histidine kinase and response regulator CckA
MVAAKHILVVEDERIVARDIQRSLTDLGYEVPETAATSDQAIGFATVRCPDLVLMDIHIKGDRDGIETAGILRKRFDVPVIYLTAYADAATVERAKITEPLSYLLKPVKPNELRSAVEIALYRHEMEKRLRERENWLTTTLRSIGDGVVSTDPSGQINYMNPVAEALIGERLEHAIGRPCREVFRLVDERSRAALENPMDHALRVGGTINVEGALANPDGSERLVTDSTAPIVDDRGRILGAVMVFRDISEQKRLQRQLEHADRLASVGIMAAGVAHEVNNPLTFILSNTRFALNEMRGHQAELRAAGRTPGTEWAAEVEVALSDALNGIERVRRIVADLKGFCRNSPGTTAAVDLHEVLEHALEMADTELSPRAVIVRKFGAPPLVEAESTRLEQVFLNILLNAAHAMPVDGGDANQVTIRTTTDYSGRALVEVGDTGPGMSPEVLKRVFEPFFTTKDAGQGTGLGLSICHGIIKSIGGEIEIESRPGIGTMVRVVLPAAHSSPVEQTRPLEPTAPAGLRGYLLVVDDEPMMRTCVSRLLEDEHAVTCPKTATEALALIDGGMRFDLILCDVMMPGLSGIDLHGQLLSRYPDQARRMAFMTGGVFTPRAVEFMRLVPNRRIDKPFDPSQLNGLVRDMLGEHGLIPREARAP